MEGDGETSRKRKGKFRSCRRKKRKGFHGKKAWEIRRETESDGRHDTGVEIPETRVEPQPSTSKAKNEYDDFLDRTAPKNMSEAKLLNSSFGNFDHGEGVITRSQSNSPATHAHDEKAHGFKVQDAELLSQCISKSAICSSCRNSKSNLQLFQDSSSRDGLAELLYLKCSFCHTITALQTSRRLGGKGGGAYEVNRRSVLSSHQWGRAGLAKFCAGMELPPPVTKKAYNQNMIQIERMAINNAEKLMCEAAERLTQLASRENEESMVDIDGHSIAKVAVSIDGTWQKRGHSSKIGVVFAVSVMTGEILDYEVKSLMCKECSSHEHCDKESPDYLAWKESHSRHCEVNHVGSSEEMESSGAIDIFSRSIEKRKLIYATFVGDGDSSCFGRVKSKMEELYGENYPVVKEECVGHVQKRLGTALRNYKKNMKGAGLKMSDGGKVDGRGRLTDNVIDKMQKYYGRAIRENTGNLEKMKNSVWAIYHHMIKNDLCSLEEQHKLCPKDQDTWCKFWKDKAAYKEDNRLPCVFVEELKPIFTRLTSDDLLKRCLQGQTQNRNESVNGQLWSRCPKSRYCGKRRVVIAVCETVGVFNTGASSKAVLMKSCGISPGRNMLKALRREDQDRIASAAHKISSKYRKRRQIIRSNRKSRADKLAYQAGAFGTSSKPETDKKKQKKKTLRKKGPTAALPVETPTNEINVVFVVPDVEFVAAKRTDQD
ncbi:uncharacterized protein [Montipora foliosa]|uniref:uncharacterized protein n=1 Tax=Montipora foliosa TaxID=591990 RepID=UPI0035F14B86